MEDEDKRDRRALDNIEEYGCHVLHVFDPDNEKSRFTYSIGIQKTTGEPELVIMGLKQELAHWIVNEYNNRIKDGEKFRVDEYYDDFIDGFQVTFKRVLKKHYKEHFGWGKWLYKSDNFDVYQLIYPSTQGVWPWDKDVSEDFTWFQPLLSES